MKLYQCREVEVNGARMEIVSDDDHQNTFVICGEVCNGFQNLSEFDAVLEDSLSMAGLDYELFIGKASQLLREKMEEL